MRLIKSSTLASSRLDCSGRLMTDVGMTYTGASSDTKMLCRKRKEAHLRTASAALHGNDLRHNAGEKKSERQRRWQWERLLQHSPVLSHDSAMAWDSHPIASQSDILPVEARLCGLPGKDSQLASGPAAQPWRSGQQTCAQPATAMKVLARQCESWSKT